jgi:hypothetical protein
MSIPCKLVKLGRVANPLMETELRLNMAEGHCSGKPPEVGGVFNMFASSPNPEASGRLVSTSQIQKVEQLGPNSYRFETFNSIYELEIFNG